MLLVKAYELVLRHHIPLSRVESVPPIRVYAIRDRLASPHLDVYLGECRTNSARWLEHRYGVFRGVAPTLRTPNGTDVVTEVVPDLLDRARTRTLIEDFVGMLANREPSFVSAVLLALAKVEGRRHASLDLVAELVAHLDPKERGELIATMLLEPGAEPEFTAPMLRAVITHLKERGRRSG